MGEQGIKIRPPSESNARTLVKVLGACVLGRGGRRIEEGYRWERRKKKPIPAVANRKDHGAMKLRNAINLQLCSPAKPLTSSH